MLRRLYSLSPVDILFLALSCLYLAAEFLFNANLLDVAGSANVDAQALHSVADFGRAVAGFGSTLLALGLFARSGFRLTDQRQKITFAIFAAVCLVPFIFFPPATIEMLFIAPVIFGLFLVGVSRGRFAFHTILAVVLMAWPAMYAAQKSMIEHLVVEPTTWQERQHARNVLLLKAGLEECVVEVAERWLCQGDKSTAEIRAVRAMIAALWMHNPEAIIAALEPQRESILEKTVRKSGDAAIDKAYQAYLDTVKAERDQMVDQLIDTAYAPYARASKAYLAAQDPQKLAAEVDAIWQGVERETDQAWRTYVDAQRQYRQTVGRASDTMLSRSGVVFEKLDAFCATRNCPRGNADRATLRLLEEAETQFIYKTGLPPTLTSKDELMSYPRPRATFEEQLNQRLAAATGLSDAVLPANWIYDQTYIKSVLTRAFQQGVVAQWRKNFGTLPAGLAVDDFFIHMKVPPIPPLEQLVMSRSDFTEGYTLPKLREKMKSTVAALHREAPLYANGEILESKGKDYIRAVYIPAIALLISLLIVSLTILRGLGAAVRLWLPARPRTRYGVIFSAVLAVAIGPFLINNSYTQSRAYTVYVAEARRENPLTATMLDWAIHVQPVVYGVIKPLIKAG